MDAIVTKHFLSVNGAAPLSLPKSQNNVRLKEMIGKILEGPITVTFGGRGFFDIEGDEKSVEISAENLHGAFHKDLVRIKVNEESRRGDRYYGEVVEILERKKEIFVGVLDTAVKGDFCYVIPDDKRAYKDIKVFDCTKAGASEGKKVVVKITDWPAEKCPVGEITETLGDKGDNEVEMKSIIIDSGFDWAFNKEIEEEAKKIHAEREKIFKKEIPKREDLRDLNIFTIDPADAKDFDDALHIEFLDNGNYKVGVHIADVSQYVKYGSAIDKEAQERAFSVYLVDRTIPMLPEILSNDLCSLNPETDRLAFSAIFEVDKEGVVQNRWFGKSIIHSKKRFTYENAQKVLDDGTGEYFEELNTMNTIAKKILARNRKNGAISFEKDEFKFELDENGVPLAIHKKERLDTHKLIEEFMLLANREVAHHLNEWDKKQKGKKPGMMYRVHDEPDPEKIEDLRVLLKVLGYELKLEQDGSISPREINRIIDLTHDKPEESLIATNAIRTMAKALYSTHNEGHFGLAFDDYTHFTSPIRRYPDLIVHRILLDILTGKEITDEDVLFFEKMAEKSSNREVEAATAERDSVKLKQVEFMQNHIGETFEGIISNVAEFGLFIELKDSGAQGLIPIKKMDEAAGDFFKFEEKKYQIVGEKTGKKYRLGDSIKVKVVEADIENKQLTLSLV